MRIVPAQGLDEAVAGLLRMGLAGLDRLATEHPVWAASAEVVDEDGRLVSFGSTR
jgi:hypothetical protein